MEKSTFYRLKGKFNSQSYQVGRAFLQSKQHSVHLESYPIVAGQYEGIDFPVIFRHEHGKKVGDMMSTGHAVRFLISDRMKALLENEGFAGWQSYPVLIFDKKGVEVPGYYGFSILGRCGPIDYSKCEVITRRYVPNGPEVRLLKGLHIGLEKWDGSDFFLPPDSFGAYCTARVVEAVRRAKLTLIDFENISDIETPERYVTDELKRDAERQA